MPLSYRVTGSGTGVLLIHGTAANQTSWQPQVEFLTGAGYQVMTVDLPGHGQSSGRCTVSTSVEAVLELVMTLKPQVVVGHSLGGVVALEVARQFPCQGLLLVCPAINIPPLTKLFYDGLVLGGAVYVMSYFKDGLKRLTSSRMGQISLDTNPRMLQELWPTLRDWSADYSHLKLPIQIAGGYLDHIAPPASLRRLVNQLPQAQLTLFQARHLPMESQSRLFNAWLSASLAKVMATK